MLAVAVRVFVVDVLRAEVLRVARSAGLLLVLLPVLLPEYELLNREFVLCCLEGVAVLRLDE